MKQSISARAVFFRDNDGDDEGGGDGDGFTVFVCFFCFFFFNFFFSPTLSFPFYYWLSGSYQTSST